MAERSRSEFSRLLAPGARFEGLLVLHGPSLIDGEVRGELLGSHLWIGRTGLVEARVEVDELVVEGRLEGDVLARRRAELLAGAQVSGELRTAKLIARQGCRLNAHCHTVGSARSEDESGGTAAQSEDETGA